MSEHKAGFVNIIGAPNAGKSTLMNGLLGEKLSVTTPKAQTTRQRIRAIVNEKAYQLVLSDTPGWVSPGYLLHKRMLRYIRVAIEDADVILFIVDVTRPEKADRQIVEAIAQSEVPVLVLLNKIDKSDPDTVKGLSAQWQERLPQAEVKAISALEGFNVEGLIERLVELVPHSPPFFDKEAFTDQPLRFFVAEMIREKIFLHYQKEVPYSSEVIVNSYKEDQDPLYIHADIVVSRKSQKSIILGAGGQKVRSLGIDARKEIERFTDRKVRLELYVRVEADWRERDDKLSEYGYD